MIFSVIWIDLIAQNPLHTADSLMNAGQLDIAALRYEYIAFENNFRGNIANTAIVKRTKCLIKQGNFWEALKSIDRIDISLCLKSGDFSPVKNRVILGLLLNKYSDVDLALTEAKRSLDSASYNDSLLYLEIIAEAHMDHWQNTYELMHKFLAHKNVSKDSLYVLENVMKKRYFKSEKTAATLSCIFPGLGQFYAGHPLQAIVSLTLTGGFGVLTGYCIYQGLYVNAAIAGLSPTVRFILGGRKNAIRLVKNDNIRKKSAVLHSLTLMLSALQQPIK